MAESLIEGRDYTMDAAGRYVFTREFLLARGECCGSACRNCPYGRSPIDEITNSPPISEQSSTFDAPKTKR